MFKESALVFAAALLAVNVFWVLLPASLKVNENSDYLSVYEPVARNFLAGKGIVLEDGSAALSYPPGYSLFLAAAITAARVVPFTETECIMQFHFIATALAALFLFLISREIWKSKAAFLTPFFWLAYPYTVWYVKQPNSEIPFLPFFYAAIFIFLKLMRTPGRSWGSYFFLGLLAGCAMMVRPLALGLGAVFAVLLFLIRKDFPAGSRIFLLAVLLTGNAAVVLPWQAWAYAKTGKIILLSDNGVYSMRDGITFAVNSKGYRHLAAVPEDVKGLMVRALERAPFMETYKDVADFMGGEWQRSPAAVFKLLFIKAARCWYGTDSGHHERAAMFVQAVYLILLSAIFAKAFFAGPKTVFASFVVILFYFWGMALCVLPVYRYLFPAFGILFTAVPVLLPRQDAGGDS